MSQNHKLLWKPIPRDLTAIGRFMDFLSNKKNLNFKDYKHLHQWSIDQSALFWTILIEYFDIQYSGTWDTVYQKGSMPGIRWFEGMYVSYSEYIYRVGLQHRHKIIYANETAPDPITIEFDEIWNKVAVLRNYLKSQGIQKGDRICAYLPNIPEAMLAFLAANSLGAVWTSCSPDFGIQSVVERFAQTEPTVLFACGAYSYNGKIIRRIEEISSIVKALPTLKCVVEVPYIDLGHDTIERSKSWEEIMNEFDSKDLAFERIEFNDPIWILYSSGTTGIPKAIVHSSGGVLLEHLKYLTFHNDVHPGQNFFWYSTTGWMMWNFLLGSMLAGANVVLYEGSPSYPNLDVLWKFAEKVKIHHFGTSAPFIMACQKSNMDILNSFNLTQLISIGSTGSPLPPEGYDYVYERIKKDIWLTSMSGGTDVCTAFVGGCPILPVHQGEIQCVALGVSLESWDENCHPSETEVGEMVITKPMPSMPIYFWNDPNQEKYKNSYFEEWAGIWKHGDWIQFTQNNGLIISGRSDATLNRHGVRIGTSEIYRTIDSIDGIKDSLIVNLELDNGNRHYMPLFVVLKEGQKLDDTLKNAIKTILKNKCSPRHVPDEIIEVNDIPYTISGKKMETPIKKILLGRPIEKSINIGSLRNPESIPFFIEFKNKI